MHAAQGHPCIAENNAEYVLYRMNEGQVFGLKFVRDVNDNVEVKPNLHLFVM
jgi:hypothetical protein